MPSQPRSHRTLSLSLPSIFLSFCQAKLTRIRELKSRKSPRGHKSHSLRSHTAASLPLSSLIMEDSVNYEIRNSRSKSPDVFAETFDNRFNSTNHVRAAIRNSGTVSNSVDSPTTVSGGKSDSRVTYGTGPSVSRYKLMSPAKLPISRSPCLTIPPGLSPSSLLESPVLLSNMKVSFLLQKLWTFSFTL